MTFTSLTFFLFLAVVFAMYWWLGDRRRQNVLLLMSSYVFYGWWDWRFCSLMLLSSVVDFFIGWMMFTTQSPRYKRCLLAASIAFGLAMLGFFKYFDFLSESLAVLLTCLGWRPDFVTLHIVLPVGISFYTFQSMSYIIDIYRGQLKPVRSLRDYLTFVSFFPQLVAGPIERASNLLPQILSPREFSRAEAVDGLRLMLWGMVKKMMLADNLAGFVDAAYSNPGQYCGSHLAFATVCFAFQIYCDFSGYSDIAVGTARLFGVQLMRNFSYPYFSRDVAEFWRCWHISLSTWFRDYVYIPLGGSRVGSWRATTNLLITFLVSGLWHGAAWTFVAWGGLNGLGALGSKWLKGGQRASLGEEAGGDRVLPTLKTITSMAGTFAFICLTWVFFRARCLSDAGLVLSRIMTGPYSGENFAVFHASISTKTAVLLILAFVAVEWCSRYKLHPLTLSKMPASVRWAVYSALLWTMFYLQPIQHSGFIYFQF